MCILKILFIRMAFVKYSQLLLFIIPNALVKKIDDGIHNMSLNNILKLTCTL